MPFDRATYDLYKQHGICPRCRGSSGISRRTGKPRVYCETCQAKMAALAQPHHQTDHYKRVRKLTGQRLAAGLCRICGEGEREYGRGMKLTQMCAECLERVRAINTRCRNRERGAA